MVNGKQKTPVNAAADLEGYRRLIEIQKELVHMAKRHEQTKRECDAIRDRMAREGFASVGWHRKLHVQLRRSASALWKRLPRFAPRRNGSHSKSNGISKPLRVESN